MGLIDTLVAWDKALFSLINQAWHPWLDMFFWAVSSRLAGIPFYALILWVFIKKFRRAFWVPLLLAILGVVLTDQGSVHLFKNVFERLRPCHHPEISTWVHLVNNHCGGKFGFISSHAANTMGFAVLVWLLAGKRWGMILVVWSLLTGYSRIYLGVHYPADVLAGYIFGAAVGFILAYSARSFMANLLSASRTFSGHNHS